MILAPRALADRNLILTGSVGPGQGALGPLLAERLRLRLVNLDAQVEARAEMEPAELAARFGEARLKIIETAVVGDALLYRGALIQINGETLVRAETSARLLETGVAVCLFVSLGATLRRLHLAMGGRYHNPSERALALGRVKREWEVRKRPGIIEIDVTDMDTAAMVEAVAGYWRQLNERLVRVEN